MEGKREIKISLGTVICIVIIVILLCALAFVYYLGFVKEDNKEIAKPQDNEIVFQEEKTNTVIQENIERVEEIKNEEEKEKQKESDVNKSNSENSLLSKEEIQRILRPDEATFCIEDIEKSGDEYIITATMLENEPRKVSTAEFEDLKNGKEIEFRGQKWTLQVNKRLDNNEESYTLHSGTDTLMLMMNQYEGAIGNIAGVATTLCDYSNQKIKFKVSKDILIGAFFSTFRYDKNGQIKAYSWEDDSEITNFESMSFKELQEISEGCHGTYDECVAYVKDGVIGAIKIFIK